MKNRSFSILIALLVAFPFMTYSLPVYSLNGSQRVSQQKRGHQGSNFVSGKDKSIFDVQFSPDGTLLAIATDLGILLYGTKTYDKPEILKGHTGEIYCIAFSSGWKGACQRRRRVMTGLSVCGMLIRDNKSESLE